MKNKPHILVVDDDERILKLLKQFLIKNDFLVSTSSSAIDAHKLIEQFKFDLMILDVMMPNITGIDFALKIKNSGSSMPIVMLTALSEPEDRVKGLESGVNDYMTKPFEPRELLIRINNLIDSHNLYKEQEDCVRFGNNVYNLKTNELMQNDVTIKLSASEEKLMNILIEAKEDFVSRERLSELMGVTSIRSVDVQIVRLRSKIESNPKNPKFLKTVRNHGYVLYT